MGVKQEGNEDNRRAVQAIHRHTSFRSSRIGYALQPFCRERSSETAARMARYGAVHGGLQHLPQARFARTATPARFDLEEVQAIRETWRHWAEWIRRHRLLFGVVISAWILPMLLSPTHPIAVYGYLAASYRLPLTPEAFASTGADLTSFLRSPAQIQRYKADLLDDMLDKRSSKFFVIVRCRNGALRQEPIRTWNGFLPEGLPPVLCRWLDRKEFPFLGDEVDVWLRGNEIIAVGHYHAFGGAPSAGDARARQFSDLPEIVIANGVVPMIYLNGDIVLYGDDVAVSEEMFRFMRARESHFVMNGSLEVSWFERPSPALKSVLGFLRDYRSVDIGSKNEVAAEISRLCIEFKEFYQAVFTKGFEPSNYGEDVEKWNFLHSLHCLEFWASSPCHTPKPMNADCSLEAMSATDNNGVKAAPH